MHVNGPASSVQPHGGGVCISGGLFYFHRSSCTYVDCMVTFYHLRPCDVLAHPTPRIGAPTPQPSSDLEEDSSASSCPCLLPSGFLWFECKEVWIEGLRSYLLDWWNFLDMVILSLYLAAFALRLLLAGLAHVHCRDAPDGAACHYFTTAGECPPTQLGSPRPFSLLALRLIPPLHRAKRVAHRGPPVPGGGAVCRHQHAQLHPPGLYPAGPRVPGHSADFHWQNDRRHDPVRTVPAQSIPVTDSTRPSSKSPRL